MHNMLWVVTPKACLRQIKLTLPSANPTHLTIIGGHGQYKRIGFITQGLLFQDANSNLFTHAQTIVVIREVMHTRHISAN